MKSNVTDRTRLLLILAAAAILWLPTVNHPFLYDDTRIILENPDLTSLANLPDLLVRDWWEHLDPRSSGNYRPLTLATFALNASLGGLHPWHFRLVNVALFIAIVFLVMRVARDAGMSHRAALIATTLFAAHPVHVEAVVGIVGRAELLMTLFVLLGLVIAHRWRTDPKPARLAAFAACLAAAALSKEQGVLLAPLAVILLALRRRDTPPISPRRWAAVIITLGAVLVAYLALRVAVLGSLGVEDIERRVTLENPIVRHEAWPTRLLTPLWLTAFAWKLLWWPAHLQIDYGFDSLPVVVGFFQPENQIALRLWLITAAIVWFTRRVPGVLWGVIIFLAGMALICNGPILTGTIFAERLLMLPSVGWALVAGALADAAWRWAETRRESTLRSVALPLLAILIIAFAARTVERCRVWRDADVFWERAIADAPRSVKAHTGFAMHQLQQARATGNRAHADAAGLALIAADKVDPGAPLIAEQRGHVAFLRASWATAPEGRASWLDLAIAQYREALQHPDIQSDLRQSLATSTYLLAKTRRDRDRQRREIADAIAQFESLIADQPGHIDAWESLYRLFLREGENERASSHLAEFQSTHAGKTLEP